MHLYLDLSIYHPLHLLPSFIPHPTHLSPSVLALFLRSSMHHVIRESGCGRQISSATGRCALALITNSVRSKVIHSGPIYNNATLYLSAAGCQAGRQSWRGFGACHCRGASTFHPFLQLSNFQTDQFACTQNKKGSTKACQLKRKLLLLFAIISFSCSVSQFE